MENQHQKIKGYRDLSQEEIDLMNEIKAKAEEVGSLIQRLEGRHKSEILHARLEEKPGVDTDEVNRIVQDAQRWTAIAKTQLQQGFMSLIRAVARPETF